MSLLPYALRPRVVLRGQIVKRGVMGGNPVLRPIAMLMVGQGVYLRRSALRHGLVLGKPLWRVIGALLLVQEIRKQILSKPPERLAVERIGADRHVVVSVTKPRLDLSRRERRVALRRLEDDAFAALGEAKRRS